MAAIFIGVIPPVDALRYPGITLTWELLVGITKATPSMMTHLGWGTFLLYAVLTYIGFVFVYFCMPEFKGESIPAP